VKHKKNRKISEDIFLWDTTNLLIQNKDKVHIAASTHYQKFHSRKKARTNDQA
jgi:hypothetical protein